MSNVHQLPDSMQRAWRIYEADLRHHFQIAGANPATTEHVIETLKPVYLEAAKPGHFSGSPDEVLEYLNAWVHQQVGRLLVLLAIREAELYELRAR